MHTLKDLKLYTEDGKYYLDAIFYNEDRGGVYRVHIPKIRLPVKLQPDIWQSYEDCWGEYCVTIDLGFGELSVEPYKDNKFYTIECIETKEREMTLAEIEKELGYKIKLKKEN